MPFARFHPGSNHATPSVDGRVELGPFDRVVLPTTICRSLLLHLPQLSQQDASYVVGARFALPASSSAPPLTAVAGPIDFAIRVQRVVVPDRPPGAFPEPVEPARRPLRAGPIRTPLVFFPTALERLPVLVQRATPPPPPTPSAQLPSLGHAVSARARRHVLRQARRRGVESRGECERVCVGCCSLLAMFCRPRAHAMCRVVYAHLTCSYRPVRLLSRDQSTR